MLSEKVAVKVKTAKEFREVVRYYEETEGWHTEAMTESDIGQYPYLNLFSRHRGIITGNKNANYFNRVLSFEEWEGEVLDLPELPEVQKGLKLLFDEL